ncbi:hypothetical protein LXL04_036099 [Taraxacum kok-saghyz]
MRACNCDSEGAEGTFLQPCSEVQILEIADYEPILIGYKGLIDEFLGLSIWIPLPEGNFVGATPIATGNLGKPGCETKCGEVTVPYPFGIDTIAKPGNITTRHDCSFDNTFNLTCNLTSKSPKLFIGSGNLKIYNISESEMRIFVSIAFRCYDRYGNLTGNKTSWTNIPEWSPRTFSQKNKFTVIGCDDYAWIRGSNGSNYASGCMGLCNNPRLVPNNGTCSGIGCCQTSIPPGLKYFNIRLGSFDNHKNVVNSNPCGFAFLGEEKSFQFGGARHMSTNYTEFLRKTRSTVHTVLDWVIGRNQSCSEATVCKRNSYCKNASKNENIGGYHCICNPGYEGNPYLDPGCQDIDECKLDKSKFPCYGNCTNTPGNYTCTCPPGYGGDVTKENGCQPIPKDAKDDSKFQSVEYASALVIGVVAIIFGIIGIYFIIRKRKLIKLREKFFEQNGGVFLKQKLKATGASHDAITMFSTEQLRNATDNYSNERIKSKLVDGTQSEQFINEILILTQVIHRNVVKLLGCCLEEEVPVLVYEFISNNTLFYHIHDRSGGMSWMSWENRLRIAAETAGALAYLHSQATMPIIHRDVKSANILLDENYTTKISDFGASRLVPIDHDQVTTLVQGTLGYLDPEYFHTSQLTDKSDVYSFGMVLAELITGRKPICTGKTNEEKNLATYFVKSMKENRLFQIVEPRLLQEGSLEQLQTVAELVKRCLNYVGEERPAMKEVAMELESLRKFTTHPWLPQQMPEESRSLILEVEQSELYDIPLIPYSSNEWESYSAIEFAKLLLDQDERLSITFLVILPIGETDLSSYIQSLAASDTRIKYTMIPPTHHFFQPSSLMCIEKLANKFKVPSYIFFTSHAAYLGFLLHLPTRDSHGGQSFNLTDPDSDFPSFRNPVPVDSLPDVAFDKIGGGYETFHYLGTRFQESKGIIVNSFAGLEPYAINSMVIQPTVYPIGLLLDLKVNDNKSTESIQIMNWLDNQPSKSVIFLCFGSMGSLIEPR